MFPFPSTPYSWVAVIAIFLIIEATTTNFVTIWFAVGGLAGFITSYFTPSAQIQLLVFAVVTAITVVATKPLVRKLRAKKAPPLNADRNIGREATVLTPITPTTKGRVSLDGVEWAAKADTDFVVGQLCYVTKIESTVLTVAQTAPSQPINV